MPLPACDYLAHPHQALVSALRANDFWTASRVAAQIDQAKPPFLLAQWALFVCSFELGGGLQPCSDFLQERNKNSLWAQGILMTMLHWDGARHLSEQGVLGVADYRFIWQTFLTRVAALEDKYLITPPALTSRKNEMLIHLAFGYGGLFCPALLDLPLPKPWLQHAADLGGTQVSA